MTPPDLDRTFALFLDVDGTLVEIAATPEAVIVAPGLPTLLAELDRQLDGAVAIISGRPLTQIDELLHPFTGSAAGEHGVAVRYGDGTLEEMPVGLAVPDTWREALTATAARWPGVRIETKPHGVTIHYRLAPERANEVWRVVRALVPGGPQRSCAPCSTSRARYSSAPTPGGSMKSGNAGSSCCRRNAHRSATTSVLRMPSGA